MPRVDVTAHEFRELVGRWEFLFAAAPLRIVGGTGSPINPTAIF
jgi:kynurenine formamidase